VRRYDGEAFECTIELFDAERDPFPYPSEYFATVLCCELIEHLTVDPMHMMSEINRILRPGVCQLLRPDLLLGQRRRAHAGGSDPR